MQATEERFLVWRLHCILESRYHAKDDLRKAEKDFSKAGELIEELVAPIPDEELKDNYFKGAHSTLRRLVC